MEFLSDTLLLNAYRKAIQLQLHEEFICLIEKEIERREIKVYK